MHMIGMGYSKLVFSFKFYSQAMVVGLASFYIVNVAFLAKIVKRSWLSILIILIILFLNNYLKRVNITNNLFLS